jgi:hypothetical protein
VAQEKSTPSSTTSQTKFDAAVPVCGSTALAERLPALKQLRVHQFGHVHGGYGHVQNPITGVWSINASSEKADALDDSSRAVGSAIDADSAHVNPAIVTTIDIKSGAVMSVVPVPPPSKPKPVIRKESEPPEAPPAPPAPAIDESMLTAATASAGATSSAAATAAQARHSRVRVNKPRAAAVARV